MQLDQVYTQTQAKSNDDLAQKAHVALAYLKRTNNLDIAEILGLSAYLEDTDDTEAEDSVPGPAAGQ